jgi:hypothetical protein
MKFEIAVQMGYTRINNDVSPVFVPHLCGEGDGKEQMKGAKVL